MTKIRFGIDIDGTVTRPDTLLPYLNRDYFRWRFCSPRYSLPQYRRFAFLIFFRKAGRFCFLALRYPLKKGIRGLCL